MFKEFRRFDTCLPCGVTNCHKTGKSEQGEDIT